MNIKPILWTYAPKKDGTCDVKIYASHKRRKKYFSTGICVSPSEWDDKKGIVKRANYSHVALNAEIRSVMDDVRSNLLAGKWTPQKEGEGLLCFFRTYIIECERGIQPTAPGTIKNYVGTLRRLESFLGIDSDIRFDQVVSEWLSRFALWLSENCRCNRPGIDKHMKQIKKMMNEARLRGLHDCTGHKTWKIRQHTKNTKIYLAEEEIAAVENLDLSKHPELQLERDRFIVSYRLILAYVDSVSIQKDFFFEMDGKHYYRNIRQKTGQESILPVKPSVMDILRRRNFDLSGDTNQEANRKLKQIAALAGISDVVREGEKTGPKWMFVSTHTARRSAATNLALNNVAITTIAQLGGWERVETLRLYLRASGVDTARAAAELEFFK